MTLRLATAALAIACAASAATNAPAAKAWLTPERAAALRRVSARPYIVSQQIDGDTAVYRWKQGKNEMVTTQRVARILGAKAYDRRAEQKESDRLRCERAEQTLAAATNRLSVAAESLRSLKKKTPAAAAAIQSVIDGIGAGK